MLRSRTRLAGFAALACAAVLCTLAAPATAATDAILKATMTGAGENPPNTSTATGSAFVFVDGDTNNVCVSFSFSGLSAPSTAGHIHEAAAGVNGPVVIPFPATAFGGTSGRKFFCTAVADTAMLTRLTTTPSNFYVNIHSSAKPGGEIRGQLANA